METHPLKMGSVKGLGLIALQESRLKKKKKTSWHFTWCYSYIISLTTPPFGIEQRNKHKYKTEKRGCFAQQKSYLSFKVHVF